MRPRNEWCRNQTDRPDFRNDSKLRQPFPAGVQGCRIDSFLSSLWPPERRWNPTVLKCDLRASPLGTGLYESERVKEWTVKVVVGLRRWPPSHGEHSRVRWRRCGCCVWSTARTAPLGTTRAPCRLTALAAAAVMDGEPAAGLGNEHGESVREFGCGQRLTYWC